MKRPLVGRHAELERLTAALDRARGGHGAVLLMSGEAGVGKTRLAGALAEGTDARALAGTASQGGTAPYGAPYEGPDDGGPESGGPESGAPEYGTPDSGPAGGAEAGS